MKMDRTVGREILEDLSSIHRHTLIGNGYICNVYDSHTFRRADGRELPEDLPVRVQGVYKQIISGEFTDCRPSAKCVVGRKDVYLVSLNEKTGLAIAILRKH